MWSILTRWHTSRQSWTPVAHRMMRRGIVPAGWAAKLLVGGCGRWVGGARWAGTLWAIGRQHGLIHIAHMWRATKLAHRAILSLLGVALQLGGGGDGRRLVLRCTVGKPLLSAHRGATDHGTSEWLPWWAWRCRRARYAIGLRSWIGRSIRRGSREGWLTCRAYSVDLSAW